MWDPSTSLSPMTLDDQLIINKQLIMMLLASLLIILLFIFGYKKNKKVQSGIGNLLEVFVVFIRDEVVYPNMGKKQGKRFLPLILTFFFRYMRELVEQGNIYIATPPLYLVKKGNKKLYAWDDDERDKIAKDLGTGVSIQRYKGLGEMNADQLWDTTMNPETRTLRQISLNFENSQEAERWFSTLMGDDVPPRRKFIEDNAVYANIDV